MEVVDNAYDQIELVSIIIPVYNIEQYIERCLKSVIGQTYRSLEIIIVDDGSTDRTGVIADNYAELDSRIRVIHKKNGGVSSARNVGLKSANGQFVSFVDGDDYVELNMVECLLDVIKKSNADISCGGLELINLNGEKTKRKFTKKVKQLTRDEALLGFFEDSKMKDDFWGPYNKLFNTELISGLQFDEDLRVGEDLLFVFHALSKIDTIVLLDIPVYKYIKRDHSASTNSFSIKSLDYVSAAGRIYNIATSCTPIVEKVAFRWYYGVVANHAFIICKNKLNNKMMINALEKYIFFLKENRNNTWNSLSNGLKLQSCAVIYFPAIIRWYYLFKRVFLESH